ncbi:MAG TPA: hypothetical protein VNT52_15105, partial [Acidimicrobiales bacterium]|nr:hypothetical protein [Acidimicrobiales bacterium]
MAGRLTRLAPALLAGIGSQPRWLRRTATTPATAVSSAGASLVKRPAMPQRTGVAAREVRLAVVFTVAPE